MESLSLQLSLSLPFLSFSFFLFLWITLNRIFKGGNFLPLSYMPHAFSLIFLPFSLFLYFFIPSLCCFAPKKIRPNLVLSPFYFYFPLITIGSSNYILFAPYLWYFYNSISSSYIMTFVSYFEKLQIYPCLFSGFLVLFPENSDLTYITP